MEGYNRSFCEVVDGKGVKIHVEVFVEKWEDAVNLVFQNAKSIKDEYERMGHQYADPFGPRGKKNQVALNEATTITEKL